MPLIQTSVIEGGAVYGVPQVAYTVAGEGGKDYSAALAAATLKESTAIEAATASYADVVRVRERKLSDLGEIMAYLNKAYASLKVKDQAPGDTASVEVRYPPDDPDRTPPLYPAVRLAVSSSLRKADGLGHGQTLFPDIYAKPSDSIRFSRSEDYSLNVRTLDGPPDFVFVRSDSTTNSILIRGAWPRGPDEAANRALLEAFLADPAGTVRTADPAVLHPFQIRLRIPDSSVPSVP